MVSNEKTHATDVDTVLHNNSISMEKGVTTEDEVQESADDAANFTLQKDAYILFNQDPTCQQHIRHSGKLKIFSQRRHLIPYTFPLVCYCSASRMTVTTRM